MQILKNILLIIVLLAIAAFLYVFSKNTNEATPLVETQDEIQWVTYRNDGFGFEIEHPVNWQVSSSTSSTTEPIINIYPIEETVEPPFIHHHDVPNVSIFPQGVPTEGIIGEMGTTSISFTESIKTGFDFILKNGDRWSTYVTFTNPGTNWEPWGFVWARAPVADLQQICMVGTEVVPMEECPLFSDAGDVAVQVVREGSVDKELRAIEEEILSTFRFIR